MTRDEAVAIIKETMGFRLDLDEAAQRRLKLAQVHFERGIILPSFLISEQSYITTDANAERIVKPSDFIKEVDEDGLCYFPNGLGNEEGRVALVKDDLDVLQRNYQAGTKGPPEAYALLGNYFRIFPTPDDVYVVKMYYYQKDEVLNSNIENKWLREVPYLLIGEAGMSLSSGARDKDAKAEFSRMKQEALMLMNGHDPDVELSNRTLQIGGPH